MKPAFWLAVGLLFGGTLPALSQSGFMSGGCDTLGTWRSNCSEPMFDIDAHHGAQGAREAQYEFADYQLCLKREADDDARSAASSVYEAAKKELDRVESDAVIWGFTVR